MARIKKCYPSQQVCHVFVTGVQDEAWNASKTVFFKGDTIYSYGYHYPMGVRYRVGTGREYQEYMLINSRGWSVTTAKHLSYLRRAIYNRNIVSIEVPYPNEPTHEANESYLLDQIADALGETWSRSQYMGDLNTVQNLNNYYKLIGSKKVFKLDAETLEDLRLFAAAKHLIQAELEAKRSEKYRLARLEREAAEERQREEYETMLPLWVTHSNPERIPSYVFPYDYIRISKDKTEVETSSGAQVPLTHARIGLAVLDAGRAITGLRLGHFTVETEPDKDGFFKVGCHNLNINQIREVLKV